MHNTYQYGMYCAPFYVKMYPIVVHPISFWFLPVAFLNFTLTAWFENQGPVIQYQYQIKDKKLLPVFKNSNLLIALLNCIPVLEKAILQR